MAQPDSSERPKGGKERKEGGRRQPAVRQVPVPPVTSHGAGRALAGLSHLTPLMSLAWELF